MFKSVTKIGYHIDNALIGGEYKIIVIKMKFNHIHKKCGHCIHRCTLKGKGGREKERSEIMKSGKILEAPFIF